MCMFSRRVESVSATNIFARADEGGRQFLVYSMTLKADEDLAMVLPLPVPPRPGEDAVRFINLEGYPRFFADLDRGFHRPQGRGAPAASPTPAKPTLAVVEVGGFEASFVPTVADFDRLDERFRLPAGTWDRLPAYKDYGFAVFKLKPGAKTVHPMAFSFPRADAGTLFFPTVHVHDGRVHATARFDHALYCQEGAAEPFPDLVRWEESSSLARTFMQVDKAQGLILGDRLCYWLRLSGRRPNQDTLLARR